MSVIAEIAVGLAIGAIVIAILETVRSRREKRRTRKLIDAMGQRTRKRQEENDAE